MTDKVLVAYFTGERVPPIRSKINSDQAQMIMTVVETTNSPTIPVVLPNGDKLALMRHSIAWIGVGDPVEGETL